MRLAPDLRLVEAEPALADPLSPPSPTTDATVVCFPFAGGVAGGSHVSACKLIQSLDSAAFKPLILLHHDGGEVADLLRAEGLAYEVAPSPHHFGRAPGVPQAGSALGMLRAVAAQFRLAAFLRRRRVRIVHTNEGPMHISWAIPAFLAGAKLLWHHRSSPDARGLCHLAPYLADKVVSVSRFALSKAEDRLRREQVAVVYSPFDTDGQAIDRRAAHRALMAELGAAPGTRIVGFFGNFTARKRPLLFVDALAEVARRSPEITVVGVMFGAIIEPGLDAMVCARAEEQGIGDRIRLMGFRYPAEPWLAACDVHAVTAIGEPFGRSLIEAMLLGTPVVAVAAGGNIEAIRDRETGLLADADNPTAIADRIVEMLRHPEWAEQVAAAARADALLRFGRERHSRAIAAIYRELLDPQRRNG